MNATRLPRTWAALGLIAASAWLQACAVSPDGAAASHTTASEPNCPDVRQINAAQLYGSWDLHLPQLGQKGQLTLRQHPEFRDSLRGELQYGGHRSIASGDVEAGEFNLDESRDGRSLFAFWSGQLVPAACGAEIRGQWQSLARDGQAAQETEFILKRRQP